MISQNCERRCIYGIHLERKITLLQGGGFLPKAAGSPKQVRHLMSQVTGAPGMKTGTHPSGQEYWGWKWGHAHLVCLLFHSPSTCYLFWSPAQWWKETVQTELSHVQNAVQLCKLSQYLPFSVYFSDKGVGSGIQHRPLCWWELCLERGWAELRWVSQSCSPHSQSVRARYLLFRFLGTCLITFLYKTKQKMSSKYIEN